MNVYLIENPDQNDSACALHYRKHLARAIFENSYRHPFPTHSKDCTKYLSMCYNWHNIFIPIFYILLYLFRQQLMRNREFGGLVQVVDKFHRDVKLSSLTIKDRTQLIHLGEDAQFFRILVRMLHEVTV